MTERYVFMSPETFRNRKRAAFLQGVFVGVVLFSAISMCAQSLHAYEPGTPEWHEENIVGYLRVIQSLPYDLHPAFLELVLAKLEEWIEIPSEVDLTNWNVHEKLIVRLYLAEAVEAYRGESHPIASGNAIIRALVIRIGSWS